MTSSLSTDRDSMDGVNVIEEEDDMNAQKERVRDFWKEIEIKVLRRARKGL